VSALLSYKEPLLSIQQGVECAQESSWTVWGADKSVPCWEHETVTPLFYLKISQWWKSFCIAL